jgi:cytidylate kinase
VGTVTIAATYGAGGSVVAPAVARRLGLPVIERAIPVELAEKLAHPLGVALAEDERHEGARVTHLLARAVNMSGLHAGAPIPPQELGLDDRIAATERALRRATKEGGAVILGRAAVFVLAGAPDVLHVRLDGPPEARLRQAMEHDGIDEATAAQRLRDTDRARAAYVRHFYPGRPWDDPVHYHLWLDATALSLDTCAELIVAAARARFGAPASDPAADPASGATPSPHRV